MGKKPKLGKPCLVEGCRNTHIAKDGSNRISFHRFPFSEPERVKRWVVAIGRDEDYWPSTSARICSMHFCEKDFDKTGQNVRLQKHADPVLRLGGQKNATPNRRKQLTPKRVMRKRDCKQAGFTYDDSEPESEQPVTKRTRSGKSVASSETPDRKRDAQQVQTMQTRGRKSVRKSVASNKTSDTKRDTELVQTRARKSSVSNKISGRKEGTKPRTQTRAGKFTLSNIFPDDDGDAEPAQSSEPAHRMEPVQSVHYFVPPPAEHNYAIYESPKKLKEKMNTIDDALQNIKGKLKTEQRRTRFLNARVTKLEKTIAALSNQRDANVAAREKILESSLGNIPKEMFERMLAKENKEFANEYSDELKDFALTLHSHSRKAYEYVREFFQHALPHKRTLRNWRVECNKAEVPELLQNEVDYEVGMVSESVQNVVDDDRLLENAIMIDAAELERLLANMV